MKERKFEKKKNDPFNFRPPKAKPKIHTHAACNLLNGKVNLGEGLNKTPQSRDRERRNLPGTWVFDSSPLL